VTYIDFVERLQVGYWPCNTEVSHVLDGYNTELRLQQHKHGVKNALKETFWL